MSSIPWTRSRSPALPMLLLAAAVAVAGCDGEILDTQDPDVVTPEQLAGPDAVSAFGRRPGFPSRLARA